jgi:hypothetical protein
MIPLWVPRFFPTLAKAAAEIEKQRAWGVFVGLPTIMVESQPASSGKVS